MISFSQAASRVRARRRLPRFAARVPAAALAVGILTVLLASAPARANPATLRRSVQNLLLAPLDLALSPVVAGAALWRNWQENDDTLAVKIAYPLPGYVWLAALQTGSSAFRELAGGLEFLPGLGLAFFPDADMDPFFELPESNDALVDVDLPAGFELRFGIDYTTEPGEE